MVLSSIADVSCKLSLELQLPLPPHCNCDFLKNSSMGAGSILVFWGEMFLGILDNFLRKFSDFFANPVEAHPDAWDIVELARSCRNNFLPIPSKVSFYMKKNGDLAGAKIYKSLKSYWLLNWVSITRVAGRCLQLLQQILKTPCFYSCPSDPPKLCRSTAPRELPLILKPLISFWNSLREWLPDDWQGLKLGLKLELCCLTNWLYRFYLLYSLKMNCVEFEFFENAEIEDNSELILSRLPQTLNLTIRMLLMETCKTHWILFPAWKFSWQILNKILVLFSIHQCRWKSPQHEQESGSTQRLSEPQ